MNDTTPESESSPANAGDIAHDFTIVGLGASAGGIKALREFFTQVPPDSGIAFVVILHLSSEHESHLAEVLQSSTPMPISQVREQTSIKPNCVYVIPPNRRLAIVEGALALSEFERSEERRAPIDFFFRTLGETKRERAFVVILSGTGTDGSSGLKRVKECGGCVYAQDPDEAEYGDMPRSAIATGLVDQVLPVAAMAAKISAYHQRLSQFPPQDPEDAGSDEKTLRDIFTQLRVHTGHEFSNYKRSTLLRRIGRRINLRDLPSLSAYARCLREHPEEIQSLLRDLLISVTNFFRDKAAFEALERDIIPRLFEGKGTGGEVRVWVAACATGEEAYSIAMLLAEYADALENPPTLQVFATDIDSAALAVARDGCYPDVATADIAPRRLQRFFVKDAAGYRVRKELRNIVLFALHNLLRDPPFSRLDLVSCRNFLIYLNREAQKRALDILHFASRPGGYAFFGAVESADGAGDAFTKLDSEHHIYQSRALAAGMPPQFPERSPIVARIGNRGSAAPTVSDTIERYSFADLHLRLLEQYAPPSVVVNEDYDIVHLSEGAGQYLQLAGGEPSHNLLKVVHYDLRLDLRTALYQATQQRSFVEARGLTISMDGGARTIDLIVRPVLREGDTARGFILVIFADANTAPRPAERTARLAEPVAGQLEEELLRVKARLRSTVEQHEVQAEEAMAANEELQAMNEELRSTGEELETGREELQSLNEELQTLNQELKIKIDELARTNDDFQNLINATDAPTIFLDRDLRVKLFTASARDIFNLIPADKGRVLSDISSQLRYPGLLGEIQLKAQPAEHEVETRGGRWYCMRVSPYRTIDNRIGGVVVTFADITGRKQAEAARIHFQALFESAPGLYVVMNLEDYRIVAVSDAFLRATMTERQFIVGKGLFDMFIDDPAEPWADGVRNLRESLDRVKSSRRADVLAVQRFPMRRPGDRQFEERWWSPINSPVFGPDGEIDYLILRVEDVTALMQQRGTADGENAGPQLLETRDQHMEAEIMLRAQDMQRSNEQLRASEDSYRLATEQLKALNERLEQRVADRTAVAEQRTTQLRALATQLTRAENRERQRIAQVLHDHLQQLLLSAKFRLRTLKSQLPQADFGPVLESLDESLIASRSLVAELRPPILYHAKLSEALRWLAEHARQQHGLAVEVAVFGREPTLDEDMKLLLFQSVRELLLNITKHAAVERAQIRVGAWRSRWLFVRVSDNGSGFRFAADSGERGIGNTGPDMSGAGSSGGTGLGLVAIRERIEVLGGSMVVRSTVGRGTRVVLRVPVERRSGESAASLTAALLARRLSDRQKQARPRLLARTRILLVDDHTMVRQGLRGLIEEEADMQVVGEAQDGLQAIALADELAPEVILMDINMPGMDGIEATRRIKAAHPEVLVIGLSMHADAGVMNSMRAAGVSEYITKDTVSDALCNAIREQVKNKSPGG